MVRVKSTLLLGPLDTFLFMTVDLGDWFQSIVNEQVVTGVVQEHSSTVFTIFPLVESMTRSTSTLSPAKRTILTNF